MTHSMAPADTSTTPETSAPWALVTVEVLAALVAVAAIPVFFFNWLDVYLVFFGETPVVEPWNVAVYRVGLGLLGGGTAVALFANHRRHHRLGRAAIWHTAVAAVGLVAAALFHISLQSDSPAPDPSAPTESHPVCFGTSGDCPGG